MRYLFLGDTHGGEDLGKLKAALPGLRLSSIDALIHCGDFGAPWAQDDDEALRWWQALPLKKIIALGNHENYGWILRQPLIRRWGARGYDLGGGLFAPLAGEIAVIGGRSFWFYTGGLSIDFFLRRPGRSLFSQELLSPGKAQEALNRLLRAGRVDYIVSHDGPREFITARFGFPIGEPPKAYLEHLNLMPGSKKHPAFLLDEVYKRPELYGRWYFGHHHRDEAGDKLRCLWNQMVLEDSLSGSIRIINTP